MGRMGSQPIDRPQRDPGISRDPRIFSKSLSWDSQKSYAAIFRDLQKPWNDCILGPSMPFIGHNLFWDLWSLQAVTITWPWIWPWPWLVRGFDYFPGKHKSSDPGSRETSHKGIKPWKGFDLRSTPLSSFIQGLNFLIPGNHKGIHPAGRDSFCRITGNHISWTPGGRHYFPGPNLWAEKVIPRDPILFGQNHGIKISG